MSVEFEMNLTPNTSYSDSYFVYQNGIWMKLCGLKFHLLYVHVSHIFFEIPLCAKEVNFITEFAFLAKIQLFYEVKKNPKEHGRIS